MFLQYRLIRSCYTISLVLRNLLILSFYIKVVSQGNDLHFLYVPKLMHQITSYQLVEAEIADIRGINNIHATHHHRCFLILSEHLLIAGSTNVI